MKNKLKQINAVCSSNSQLKKLSQRVQQLNQLNYILQQVMPPQFSAHCRLANIKQQTLVIHTDNASYASLLRFQAKTICSALSKHLSQPVTQLELKVRPLITQKELDKSSETTLSENAAKALNDTAEHIENGPLKTALERLAKRHHKKD